MIAYARAVTGGTTIRQWIARRAPRYSTRRLALQIARDTLRQPTRLPQRVNRANVALHRFFRDWPFTCNVCGHTGTAFYAMPDLALRAAHGIGPLRETLSCRECGSSNRHRALVAALLAELGGATARDLASGGLDGRQVLDTDNYSALARTLTGVEGYHRSVFIPGRGNGEQTEPGVTNADLERLPFDDKSFDVILTADVMEHVRDYRAAHREITRCLRPGGVYIFTVPFDPERDRTRVLVDVSTDVDIPLGPAHMHGDPIRGGIKSYRIFGRELLAELRAEGLTAEIVRSHDPAHGVLDVDVIVARRD